MNQTPAKPIRALRRRKDRHGFTLIEAVMSMLVVGLMLVAALNTVGASRVTQTRNAEQSLGPMLAEELMTEILSQAYEEPVDTPGFGRESESGGDRADWDDVDDYDGWSASPPQTKDGTDIPDLDGWERSVTVLWVKPPVLNESGTNTGVKRIDIQVLRHQRVVSELSALRTSGWPEDQDQQQPPSMRVLFVVVDSTALGAQEQAREDLVTAWGYSITRINASASQTVLEKAAANHDVVYIPVTIDDGVLSDKLAHVAVGVVFEKSFADKFGFVHSAGDTFFKSLTDIRVDSDGHYIVSPFTIGPLTIVTAQQSLGLLGFTNAPGAEDLATAQSTKTSFKPSLVVCVAGDELINNWIAEGRRVKLPWGATSFDINALNDAGKTIMKRSIEWAANMEQP